MKKRKKHAFLEKLHLCFHPTLALCYELWLVRNSTRRLEFSARLLENSKRLAEKVPIEAEKNRAFPKDFASCLLRHPKRGVKRKFGFFNKRNQPQGEDGRSLRRDKAVLETCASALRPPAIRLARPASEVPIHVPWKGRLEVAIRHSAGCSKQ